MLTVALAVLGVAALGAGGTGLTVQLTREPTAKEKSVAADKEILTRWRGRTAAEIFPAAVTHVGKRMARRVGIAPPAGCAQALDPRPAGIVTKQRCLTVLRATYTDDSGTLVATIGLVVMPSRAAAVAAITTLDTSDGAPDGLRAVAFPGTPAEKFGDRQRQRFGLRSNTSPYLFMHTSGWADGRPRVPRSAVPTEPDIMTIAIVARLAELFNRGKRPCATRGIRC